MDTPLLALTRRPAGFTAETAAAENTRQLIQLRWIAVAGQTLAILFVHFGLAGLSGYGLFLLMRGRRPA